MIEIKNTYFKATHDEGPCYMSGLPLPAPDKGPYHFMDCDIHPRLWETMRQVYFLTGSTFENTWIGTEI